MTAQRSLWPGAQLSAVPEKHLRDALTSLTTLLATTEAHTVRALVDRWWQDNIPRWSDGTRRVYTRYARVIGERIGDVLCTDVRLGHARDLASSINASESAAQTVECFRRVLRHGARIGWVPGDPLAGLPRYESRTRGQILELGQMHRLHRALGELEDAQWPSAGRACAFLLWTGLRNTEGRGLLWDEVTAFGSLDLPGRKRGNRRVLPLMPLAQRVLRTMPRRGDYVFPGFRGATPVSASSCARAWKAACERADVPQCTPYTARHSLATHFADQGATAAELQAYFGWRSEAMVLRYTHTTFESLQQLVRKVGG